MDKIIEEDLIEYVTNQKTTEESKQRIKQFCEKQTPVSLVLYRGHKRSTEIKYNSFWYSATKSKKVAKEEFSSGNCCVFKINIINVPMIDINTFIGNKIGDFNEEEECIFLGGGTFYKDSTLNEKGFTNKGNGEFECWYIIEEIKEPFNIDNILKIIPEEEYEFIDKPSDIIINNLSETEKQLVFDKIKELKMKTGGRKTNKRKRRKINKKKTKKINKKSKKSKNI